jgi:molecular chaperone DnaK (HSP70)
LTQLLYSPDKSVAAWGYEARWKLGQLRKSQNASDYNFFYNFKMDLHERKNGSKNGPVVVAQNGHEFPVLNLISDYLKHLKDYAMQEVKESVAGQLKDDEILWCLTVPAIWSPSDKQLMRNAARDAGIIGSDASEDERLLLVLEPEAAAIHCQEKQSLQLPPGTRFIIVDCGGGTVDITAHETMAGNTLSEIAVGTGGAYGSIYVDRTFMEYLKSRLTPEAIDSFHDEEPMEYLEMLSDWERIKCGFDPGKNEEVTYFPLRVRLYNLLNKNFPHILERLAAGQKGDDENVFLSRGTMESIFRPVLDNIVQTVGAQLSRLGKRGCDYIFLVGGFSTSPLLKQRIRDEFGGRVKDIIVPPVPGAAIVEGAVSFGLNPEKIRARRSRLTYGCEARQVFISGVHQDSKRIWSADHNAWYCKDWFSIFIRAGESVALDDKRVQVFHPMARNQTSIQFNFFATKRQDARYIDEDGVEKIGEMTVEIPDITRGLNRDVDVAFYFGKTEIKVEANDKTSGKQHKASLRFSSTYSPELIGD